MSLGQFPDDLTKSAAEGKLRVFVGSGPSCAAGMPGWDALIADMSKVMEHQATGFSDQQLRSFLDDGNHLDIAELFRTTVGDFAYFRFLRERYRVPLAPSRSHHAVARLPADMFFTTNYDHLLEAALARQRRIDPAVIISASQLNYIDDETRVVKLHGDIDHPSTIVLTRTDYAAYNARHRELADVLRTSLNGWTLLFVGFGLRDPNFQRIYSDARNYYDSTNRQAYAIMADTNDVERSLWQRDGLTVIPLARRAQLSTALGSLATASSERR